MTSNAQGGYTAAARGDHRYDVRTLEADKPAVVGSVPLIWMLLKPCDADVNSRLGDARRVCPAVFTFVLYITCQLAQCHSVGTGPHHWLTEHCSFTFPTQFIFSCPPTNTPSLSLAESVLLPLFHSSGFAIRAAFSDHSCALKFLVTHFIWGDVKA